MVAFASRFSIAEQRAAARDEVSYRTRCTSARGVSSLQIVNISASGFMARTEGAFAEGDRISVNLPLVGTVPANVRWALGGRIGCQFEQMIGLAAYLTLLSELVALTR